MSDLPEAQSADDLYEPNAKARRAQRTLYLAVAALLAIVGGFYVYSQFGKPPAARVEETRRRMMATADIARDKDPPEVVNGDLSRQVAQLQAQNSDLQAQNLQLKDAAGRAEATQLEERTNGLRTIQALQEELDRRGAAPPPRPGPVAGATPAPPLTPVPAISDPKSDGTAAGAELSVERPRRTMTLIRASTSGRNDASVTAEDGGAPAPTSTSPDLANRRAASASTPAAKPVASGGAAYFSSRLESFATADFVPPNAYAEAQVLVGVDSATSVGSAADPKPVLFRMTGDAISVGADGRYQSTPLKGCLVNGAAYGELSSEKIYVKLQRITCPDGPRRFSVATVEGFVTQKGKAGVRGAVVERSGGLTARAVVAGTLQGLGTTLSQNLARSQSGLNAVSGAGGVLAAEKLSGSELAQGAVGSGVSNAASMLAEYYIKRAEQYQPVIEMPTGITVEIVFLSGFQVRGAPSPAPASEARP